MLGPGLDVVLFIPIHSVQDHGTSQGTLDTAERAKLAAFYNICHKPKTNSFNFDHSVVDWFGTRPCKHKNYNQSTVTQALERCH